MAWKSLLRAVSTCERLIISDCWRKGRHRKRGGGELERLSRCRCVLLKIVKNLFASKSKNSKIGSDFRDIGWNQQYNTANSQAIFWGLEFGWKNGPPAQSGFHQHTSKIQFHQLFGCENHGIRWRLTPYPTTDPQRNDSNWVSEINIFGLVGVG